MQFLKDFICKTILQYLEYFRSALEKRVKDFGAQYIAFGIFGVLNYPLFYLIWIFYNHQSYESFWLRFTATVLCLILLLKNYWPERLKPWLPVYWYFTLLFCLPFFFFFMLFKNNGASVWLMSSNTILFWLLLMIDWVSYIVVFSLGVILAIIFFVLTTNNVVMDFNQLWGVASQFIASFVVVAFFARKKYQFDEKKLTAMQLLSATTAHELRTPLRTISSGIASIKKCLPALMQTYDHAKQKEADVPVIESHLYKVLPTIFNNVESETRAAFTVVDMLLVKVNQLNVKSMPTQMCSMIHCIDEALRRYPFDSEDRELVHWDNKNDFKFRGDEMLMIHVLFNLLKNALHYIKVARKGDIKIWLETSKENNILYFKDTGTGISVKVLPHIFDRFFTQTRHGTGIGLAFCKAVVENFGGEIVCDSVEGEYTEFVLYFPKEKED